MASTISRDIDTGMSCLLVETVVCGYHVYKVLWEPRVGETFIALHEMNTKLILNRDQLVKYLGFPLPELEIIYPICAKGCRKMRDAEFLEDIQYIHTYIVLCYMISYLPQQLVLETRLGDSKVDDSDLDANLGQVVRVGEL